MPIPTEAGLLPTSSEVVHKPSKQKEDLRNGVSIKANLQQGNTEPTLSSDNLAKERDGSGQADTTFVVLDIDDFVEGKIFCTLII